MQKITTFLTFNDQAEEAVNFYVSTFQNSRIVSLSRSAEPGSQGALFLATFELDGQQFMALNGGPHFSFAQGISLFVSCQTQEEIDQLWDRLSQGGEKMKCGWLKDKFGVSWQIVPSVLGELLRGGNPGRSKRVMEALLKMDKLDIAGLTRAYEEG